MLGNERKDCAYCEPLVLLSLHRVLLHVTHLHLLKVAVWVRRRHAHRWVDRGWWSGPVRSSSWAGIVLAATPGETNTRVADRIALHLVDGHLGGVTLNELNEAASFAWGDLDIGDLAKALEERPEFILGDVSREASNEDGGVVRVSELVHGLRRAIVAHWRGSHGVHSKGASATAGAGLHVHATRSARAAALVLGGRS